MPRTFFPRTLGGLITTVVTNTVTVYVPAPTSLPPPVQPVSAVPQADPSPGPLGYEHLGWDNVEAVTLEIDRGASMGQRGRLSRTDLVPIAKRTALTRKELAASGGVYVSGDIHWHLPNVVLTAGVSPKPGDVIIDGDQVRWTVLEADLQRWRQRWKLICRNLAIAYDLRDTIDVQRATIGSDSAGAPTKTFPPAGGLVLYRGLPCRVQALTADVVEERGIRGREVHYDVIVDRQVNVDTEDRIVWNGQILDITGYRQPELITDLPVLEATAKV